MPFVCGICGDTDTDVATTTAPCGHSVHVACLEHWSRSFEWKLPCFTCRRPKSVTNTDYVKEVLD